MTRLPRPLRRLPPLLGSPRIPSLGVFIDGTGADWWDEDSQRTAVRSLYDRYHGQKEYIGGPGTDRRGILWRLGERYLGWGTGERLRKIAQELQSWRPEVLDLFGWSRGGDESYHACELARVLGVPVRFLGLFDPVPARGLRALLRVIPFAPLPRAYPRPPLENVRRIAQLLAGDEHSRILRNAVVELADEDALELILGDHGDTVGAYGQSWMAVRAKESGVPIGDPPMPAPRERLAAA